MKGSSANVDNLNMAIPSRRILSYLPHMLDERQGVLTRKLVQLANHLGTQGAEASLLNAIGQERAIVGDARSMATAYRLAMACGGDCGAAPSARGVQSDARQYPTLTAFVRGFGHKPGFHRLFAKVAHMLHSGEHGKLYKLASSPGGYNSKLCGHCQQRSVAGNESMYCVSAVPGKLVHSPTLGFDYKPASALSRKALDVPHLRGGVIVSTVLPYGPLADKLQPYDVVSAVRTVEGEMQLDEQGEHYNKAWGLSLGLSDVIDRAPLSTPVELVVHRAGRPVRVQFTHAPLTADQRPAVRTLDASEAHLNAALAVAGVSFKILRMSDLADPSVAQSGAALYGRPSQRHLEKVIVSAVDPASALFHDYSLGRGQVVQAVNRQALPDGARGGAWRDFLGKLVAAGNSDTGLAMLQTECGGVDTFPVTPQEAAQITQYLEHTAPNAV